MVWFSTLKIVYISFIKTNAFCAVMNFFSLTKINSIDAQQHINHFSAVFPSLFQSENCINKRDFAGTKIRFVLFIKTFNKVSTNFSLQKINII